MQELNSHPNRKKFLWLLGGLVVLVVVLTLIVFRLPDGTLNVVSFGDLTKKEAQKPDTQKPKNPAQSYPVIVKNKVSVQNSVMPGAFPKDFPKDPAGSIVVDNYTGVGPTGKPVAHRQITNSKSGPENLKYYNDYLTKNGWRLAGVEDLTGLTSLVVFKEKQQFEVKVTEVEDKTIIDLVLRD